MTNNGTVGINDITPSESYKLDVSGAVNATSYNATSDYRVKTNVMALDASFNVDVLKPVTYTNTRHGRQDIGFIAHEVQEHYPFLVNGEKDGEQIQSLNYIGLIGILTKEIQDLKRRLAETEAKNTTVEKKIDANMEQVYSMLTSADNHNQTVNKKIDANMEQVYSMLTSAETKVASIEETVASIENDAHTRFSSVEAKVLYVDTRVATVENAVHSVENTIASVENTIHSVENTIASVENTVHSVENTVLLEQARLAICETDVALSKSAIKDLEEKFQS
jgi:predicted  nucleic acid-binding Zn-ribbon protein